MNLNLISSKRYFFKAVIILILVFVFDKLYIAKKKENIIYNIQSQKIFNMKPANDSYLYFICFISLGKLENLYLRELIQHYLKIGFDKFYLGDDNQLNSQKLSDVIQDYIDKGYVDILDVRGKNWTQLQFFQYAFEKNKYKCKWMSFFDFDEYLEFNDKNMTIKDYLSLDIFNKCDVVKIHWLMFYDNDLVYYDNRTLKERFTKPTYHCFANNYIKSIVRGKNYNGIMWNNSVHQPTESLVKSCNEIGQILRPRPGILTSPIYKYGYLRHHSSKTIDEYANKLLRGNTYGYTYNYSLRVDSFFQNNKFTEEKLAIIEKKLNTTFPKYHKKIYKEIK